MRRLGLVAIGVALILDGIFGWSVNVVAVVLGLVLIGAVSADQLAALIGRRDRPTSG